MGGEMGREEAVAGALAHVEGHRDAIVALAQELVSIPTVNPKFESAPGLNREAEAQAVIADRLRRAGMDVDVFDAFPDRPNVVGRLDGSDERGLILNGHIDVVPVGDRDRWSVEPFTARVKDGRLYGRGSYDMKGGLAAAVAAVEALHDGGVDLTGSLAIHSVVDEEAGGFGTREIIERGHTGSAVIVAEPTQGQVMVCQPGLEWVRVTIRGAQAHAGWRYNDIYPQPDSPDRMRPGVNAAELVARFITAVGHLERSWAMRKYHPLLPPGITTISPSVVQVGFGLGEDGLPVTMTNPATTPDVGVVDFDLKYLPTENSAQIRADFEEFVRHWAGQDPWLAEHPPTVTWELGDLHFPAFDTDPDSPLVASIRRQCEALGRSSEVVGFPAVCDGAFYVDNATPVIYGPRGADAHGPDEWVDIESIIDVAKVMAVAAIDHCGLAGGPG